MCAGCWRSGRYRDRPADPFRCSQTRGLRSRSISSVACEFRSAIVRRAQHTVRVRAEVCAAFDLGRSALHWAKRVRCCSSSLRRLLSAWADTARMGRFEVYDAASRPLRRQPCVYAVPNSINSLPGTEGACDVRTPDKLSNGKKTQSPPWTTAPFRTSVSVFAGINCTWEDRNMWLAPFEQNAPGKPQDNVVYAVWDEAVSISIIKLWNYSKVRPRLRRSGKGQTA